VLKQKGAVDTYDLLTSRERGILQLLAEGDEQGGINGAQHQPLHC